VKYAFRFTSRALRQLRALPQQEAITVLRGITPLGDDPRRQDADIKKLVGQSGELYRIRVGVYRILYQVHDGQLLILVVGVGHRREICPDL
jgi:mRNA interferase RelE/StbE